MLWRSGSRWEVWNHDLKDSATSFWATAEAEIEP